MKARGFGRGGSCLYYEASARGAGFTGPSSGIFGDCGGEKGRSMRGVSVGLDARHNGASCLISETMKEVTCLHMPWFQVGEVVNGRRLLSRRASAHQPAPNVSFTLSLSPYFPPPCAYMCYVHPNLFATGSCGWCYDRLSKQSPLQWPASHLKNPPKPAIQRIACWRLGLPTVSYPTRLPRYVFIWPRYI